MKYTLLQMTQDILSGMSSDEVNSIGDTAESMQVATIIRQKYFDIINRLELPDHEQLIQLQPSLDPSIPVLMYIPDGVSDIKWIKYYDSNVLDGNTSDDFAHDLNVDLTPTVVTGNGPPGYQYVTILPIKNFIDMVNSYGPTDTDVIEYTFTDSSNKFNGSYKLLYKNDQQPRYCTILSNYYVLFDGYDASQDDTLQGSKCLAYGEVIPQFLMEDNFIPDLAEEQFQLLLNEAKALAFFELKQQMHPLAAQETRRGWTSIQKKKAVANRPTYFEELPGFGRHRSYYGFQRNGGFLTDRTQSGW